MTLDELVDWIDEAMERLPRDRARDRVRHVRRLYGILDEQGPDWDFRHEWHGLAVKVAKVLKEPAPPTVDARPTAPSARVPRRPSDRGETALQKRPKRWRPRSREMAKRPAREPIEMNAQLQAAFDAVAAGRQIVFVTGGAGTGKSTFIRELRERFPDKESVVLAPTGVAALNAGGQTIHSFCKLPLRAVLPEDAKKADEPELIAKIDLMIVDEISMVRADILDGVDAFLRLNRRSDAPFGGVQMVLVGDLFQLPPVVTSADSDVISQRYETPWFFSANCLRGLRFFPVELAIVYRQREALFAEMLAALRDGNDVDGALRELNRQCVGRKLHGQHLILVPTRRAAAEENDARLTALPGKLRAYEAKRDGSFANASEERLPAPARLELKSDAQVMFVRNDPEKRWVNGTLGVVLSLHGDRVSVLLEDGSSVEVEATEWQDVRYAIDATAKKIVEEVAGTYVQFPLIPAWAVTIHKAQGLTLARVDVDLGRGAFAEGQAYVALSRCQTIDGLSLRRAIRASDVRCSEAARDFYRKIRSRALRVTVPAGV